MKSLRESIIEFLKSIYVSELFEVIGWLLIGYLVSVREISYIFYFYSKNNFLARFQNVFLDSSSSLVISILIFVFPFIFKFVYLNFPIHYLKSIRGNPKLQKSASKKQIKQNNESSDSYDFMFFDEERSILHEYLIQSSNLSDKILSRTNLYLFLGSIVALLGVLFFYLQSASDTIEYKDFTSFFSHSFPRLGTLIFIEAIAFFFLRQYRITMDEFRYYEAIKRQRENQIAIISLIKLFKNEKELLEVILNSMNLNYQPDKLNKDEVSQILESQKINNQSDVIDKFIELLKITK